MKITFLGTTGGILTAEKSNPSILIDKSLLLDCGEGTSQRLMQVNSIDTIETICLSHLHGDHLMGLSYLLWYFAVTNRKKDLTIIGPSPVKEKIMKMFEFILYPLDSKDILKSLPFMLQVKELTNKNDVIEVQHGYRIKYAEMVHPVPTLAYRIEKGAESVCYSGDTSPNQKLIELADKCDIFICEATFSDDQIQRASQTGHCTPSDAARMGSEANCLKLVLVHISQHFEEAISNSIDDIKKIFNKEIVLADDLMTLEIN